MIKRDDNKEVLTEADKTKFRKLLLSKRAEILGDVGSMENSVFNRDSNVPHSPLHMADIGSDNYETENLLGLMESERKLLIVIEEAIKRLDSGVFGICLENEELIPKARLKAIPWTKYCMVCAGKMEKFGRAAGPVRKKYYYAPGNDDFDDDDDDLSVKNVMNYEKD